MLTDKAMGFTMTVPFIHIMFFDHISSFTTLSCPFYLFPPSTLLSFPFAFMPPPTKFLIWEKTCNSFAFFYVQKPLNLMKSHLSILAIISWAVGVLFRKLLSMPIYWSVFPIFSCSRFKVSGLILRPFIHFELIFVQGEVGISFSLLHVDVQIS
jgi:hypothetical protein